MGSKMKEHELIEKQTDRDRNAERRGVKGEGKRERKRAPKKFLSVMYSTKPYQPQQLRINKSRVLEGKP